MTLSKLRSALDLCVTDDTARCAPSRTAHDEVMLLFDACGSTVVRYIRSLGVGPAAAQDVAQEVFLALFHHVRMGRPRDNLRGWIFRVAHNLALKHRQRQRREADLAPEIERAALVIDPSLNPEDRLAEEQHQLRLQAVLRALPERERMCLSLRAEGLKYREIATVLGISLGAVAKAVSRALTRLANV